MSALKFLISHRKLIRKSTEGSILPRLTDDALKSLVQLNTGTAHTNIRWRGRGGGLPTSSAVDFDRRLDKISIWLERWSHQEMCQFLEELLQNSNHTQIQLLTTVLQPMLHRDFMYTARSAFPDIEFLPVSTYFTRKLKDKLTHYRLNTFYRVASAYRQTDEDIEGLRLLLSLQKTNSITQSVPQAISSRFHVDRTSYKREIKSLKTAEAKNVERWVDCGTNQISGTSNTQDAVLRFVKMPVRRHIQNEQMLKQENKVMKISQNEGLKPLQAKVPDEGKMILQWYMNSWNDTRRNEFLHKLLLKLDPRQQYFLANLLSIKEQKDIVGQLPENLALKVLNYLTPKEILIASQVCRKWKCLANSNELWKSKCQEVALDVPISFKPEWKEIYKDNFFLRQNWKKGLCKTIEFKDHTKSVLCVTCFPPCLASGSADKTIKIWDMNTGQLQNTLIGHSGGIWCIQFLTKHLLISGSFDSTIRIWDLRTKATIRMLLGHKGQIWCLKRIGSLLMSGSQDKTAKIWNIKRCLLVHTLSGHDGAVFSVDVTEDSSLVITASADKSVRMWMTSTGQLVKVIYVSPTTSVMSVSYSQGYYACCYNGIVCLYQGETLLKSFEEHLNRVESVHLRITNAEKGDGYIVSAGKDGLIKLWDTTRAKSLQTFSGHNKAVKCIFVDNLHIVSASADKKIRLWNFNIGMPAKEDKDNDDELEIEDDSKYS